MTNYARRLGLFSGTMAVVGGIIGGGIFRTPATVAERLGTPGGVLFAWVLGGAVALIGAFCWGELGQRRPRAGGGYVYLRETFGPLSAFLYGWTLVLIIATGAIAAVAVTFADYTLALVGLPQRFSVPLAVAAIVFLAAINYVGVRPAAITQNIFTVLKLTALAALIAAGLALSTFGFLNLVILVTPRVLQAMAADGVFFRRFAILHPAYQTPTAAIVALATFAVALTLTGTFGQLVDYVTFGDWIFFGLTAAALFIYRKRDQSPISGFRVPAYPATVIIFVLAAAYVVFSSIVSNPRNAAIGAGLIGLGVPAFLYWRSRP